MGSLHITVEPDGFCSSPYFGEAEYLTINIKVGLSSSMVRKIVEITPKLKSVTVNYDNDSVVGKKFIQFIVSTFGKHKNRLTLDLHNVRAGHGARFKEFGNLRAIYMHDSSGDFHVQQEALKQSLVTTLRVIKEDGTWYTPLDTVDNAEAILKNPSYRCTTQRSPYIAYILRKNRRKIRDYNTVCAFLFLALKPIVSKDIALCIISLLTPNNTAYTKVVRYPKYAKYICTMQRKRLELQGEEHKRRRALAEMRRKKRKYEAFLDRFDANEKAEIEEIETFTQLKEAIDEKIKKRKG